MRERTAFQKLGYYLLAPAAVGLVMAVIGPFGTFADLTFSQRSVYWVSIFLVNWAQVDLLVRLMSSALAEPKWPHWVPTLAAAALASVPATVEVYFLEWYFRTQPHHESNPGLIGLYPYVLVLTVAITLPVALLNRRSAVQSSAAARDEGAREPRFLRRIPSHLEGNLLCLQMEDHYLRIHTMEGSELILMRMRDAIEELEGANGLQVHRSYWVARDAVQEVCRDGGKPVLLLSNGMQVPISRTYLPKVRAAGWLGPTKRELHRLSHEAQ